MSQDRSSSGMVIAVIGALLIGLVAVGYLVFGAAGTGSPVAPVVAGDGPTPPIDGARRPQPTGDIGTSPSVSTSAFTKPTARDIFANNLQVAGTVRNRKGAAVQGALVELVADLSSMINRTQEGDARVAVQSDDRGSFVFEPMVMTTTERFLLRVSHPAYATARIPDIDPRKPESLARDVILEDGSNISGVVKDTDGRPLPSAKVTFYDLGVQAWDPDGAVEKTVTTDAAGAFKAVAVTQGMKKVCARLDGFATAGRATLVVESGKDLVNVDIVMARGMSISGVVTASDTNEPIANALISARAVRIGSLKGKSDGEGIDPLKEEMLRDRRARAERGEDPDDTGDDRPTERASGGGIAAVVQQLAPSRLPNSVPADTARSGKDGRFEVKGLEEGAYVLTVIATGYAPPQQPTADTGTTGLAITLIPNARIIGQVVDDETNKPVMSFTVAVSASSDAAFIPPAARKPFGPPQTAEGNFEYRDVRPGTWWLVAEAPGYAGGRSEPVTIAQGERREGIIIRMSKGATVTGRLVDSSGKAVMDALVEAEPQSSDAAPRNPFTDLLQREMRREVRSARTDKDGKYILPNLLEGTFVFVAKHPEFAVYKSDPFPVPRSGEIQRPDARLIRGGIIRGRVKGTSGTGDPKAMVQITPAAGGTFAQRQAYTDSEGKFEATGLSSGTYYVSVPMQNGQFNLAGILSGAARKTTEGQTVVTLAEGQVVELDL